jgi:hypothetical protein
MRSPRAARGAGNADMRPLAPEQGVRWDHKLLVDAAQTGERAPRAVSGRVSLEREQTELPSHSIGQQTENVHGAP